MSATKIAIIEDDGVIRQMYRMKFESEGFEVDVAENGRDGVSLVQHMKPDLILLDIVMPKMDGLNMMRNLRQSNSWGKNVPIILLTNLDAHDERINEAIANDEPAYYLMKSNWSMSGLVEKIKERLSSSI